MTPPLFSIGHSTHPLERFVELLAQHGIQALADIRRFPGSRKYPHFNQEELAKSLRAAGVEYHWLEALGGRRPKQPGNPTTNAGLRHVSFRNYADYMLTEPFRAGLAQLLAIASETPTAMMCSESVYWSCHRRLVSDFLLGQGMVVQHIMPSGVLRPHALTQGASLAGGELSYPAAAAGEAAQDSM